MVLPQESRAQDVSPSDTIIIGLEKLNNFPYHFSDSTQVSQGYFIDLVQAWAADQDRPIKFKTLSVKALYRSMMLGYIHMKIPDNPNWAGERKLSKSVYYSRPIATPLDASLTLPAKAGIQPSEVRSVGTVSGFTALAWQRTLKRHRIEMKHYRNDKELVRALLFGEVDVIYMNKSAAKFISTETFNYPKGAIKTAANLPQAFHDYFISSTNSEQLIENFNQWYYNNKKEVLKIKIKWGLDD